jgi:hypothetical protein
MEVTQTAPVANMGPPALSSPNIDRPAEQSGQQQTEQPAALNGGQSQPANAASAAQQPKVVQTAFIHKLYKWVCPVTICLARPLMRRSMLEDQSIQHLISWSNTNESFVMSPSTEFSKVLA